MFRAKSMAFPLFFHLTMSVFFRIITTFVARNENRRIMNNEDNSRDVITSVHNPRVKQLMKLQQSSAERRKMGLFVVEGRRELEHCIEGGYAVRTLILCPELIVGELPAIAAGQMEVSAYVYSKIAYRGTTEGLMAVVEARTTRLDDLRFRTECPLLLVLESVEKPGNLGAVLRSADAAGADAVIVCDPLTDIYNPNIIRSSIGAVFTVPCVAVSSDQCIDWLQRRGIQILTAQLQDSHLYYNTDMQRATALVMGTESTGLTDAWRQAATSHIRIPMLGRLDSLNVSVSAAILLYEAVRQRKAQ